MHRKHDGEETMASLTDALVRLLLDSGSGVSACSLEFAPHVKTLSRIVLDEHDSFIEDKKTGKRIPVELTRGDVFEISAYMSPNSHGLPKKPVLICPNEVEEAEDPEHEELDESIPEPDVVPRGVAVPQTPSDKES